MHAVTLNGFGGPEVMTWSEVAGPGPPGPGAVTIQVAAAGVNRADLIQRQGFYPPPPGAPDILGLEVSGTVVAVGDGVTSVREGDQVCALLDGGGYAEMAGVAATQVMPLPGGVGIVAAAGLPEVACTVWSNVCDVAGLRAGETILIHGGASGVGTMAIQVADRIAGATVIVTAGSDVKLARCRELGAAVVINHRTEDFVGAVRDATGGRGADVILDVVGAAYLERNIDALAPGGRIVTIGLAGGARGELDFRALMSRRGSIHATTLRARPAAEKAAIVEQTVAAIWPAITDGRIRPVIDRVLPMRDAAAAHRVIEAGEHIGKVLLDPR